MISSTVGLLAGTATTGTATTGRTPSRVRPIVGSRAQITLGVLMSMIYLLALGGQQDRIAIGVIAVGACMAIVWPAAGLAMFAIIMPMREPEILVPIRFNAVMAGAIALGCLLRLPMDRLLLKVHPGIVILLGYVIISALSIPPVLSGHPPDWTPSAMNQLLRLSTGVALFLSASYLFKLMSPRAIVVIALIGATLTALLALGDILHFLPFEGLTHGLVEKTGGLRASGAFADPNFLGLYIATAAVFVLGVLVVASRPLKVLLIPIVILLFVCVALTYSRGAYLGAVAGVVVLAGLRNRVAGLMLLIAAGILAVTLYPAFLEARQGQLLSPIDTYDMVRGQDTRTTIAAAGLAMFAAFPVFGVGFGVFQFVSPSYITGGAPDSTYSHNQYVNILAEQGIVGILLVGAIVVLVTVALARSRSPLRAAALAMGATYLASSLFLHSATVFQSSSLIWLVMAAALVPGPDRTDQVTET